MMTRKRNHQSGVALLIVILALLLVTAVAAGMMIYSTSEVKVDANYRDEQVALFAAKAGLEEARDRMLSNNANAITTLPTVVPSNGCSGCATYIVSSNSIQPWSTSSPNMYGAPTFDSEFLCEFDTTGCSGSFTGTSTLTNASYSGPTANPLPYQWVRINLKTNETFDSSTGSPHWVNIALASAPQAQVMFDSNPASGGAPYECVTGYCPSGDSVQPVYEVTSYAVTPSGTIRTLQDDVAAFTFNLKFPSSLTLPGPIGSFNPPNSKGYCMSGNDTSQAGPGGNCSYTPPPAVPGCSTSSAPQPAVGVTQGNIWDSSTSNQNYVTTQINNTGRQTNYTGSTGTPSVANVTLPSNLSSPDQLTQQLSAIQQNANVCLGCSASSAGGTYTFSNLDTAPGSLWGSCGTNCGTTPQITYVNGNLDISGSNTGSGILVVTGNLTYDGNSSWNGIIMVVGNGMTTYVQNGAGNGQFNGAIFVADITTQGCSADQTHCYGPADFTINGGGGNGIYYNSCWINNVQKAISYTVLSSNEISQ